MIAPETRETHIEAALKDDPNLAEAHEVLGGLLENRGQSDAARVPCREAVRIGPDCGKAHRDLGAQPWQTAAIFRGAAEENFAKPPPTPTPSRKSKRNAPASP